MTTNACDPADLVAAVRTDLGMSQAAFGAMTGRSAESIRRYEHGDHRPPAIFFHDLLEAAPECGLRFNDIATVLGYRLIESVDPARYASIHDYFLGVRILSGRTRAGFAAILGVSPLHLASVEHGIKPHPDLVRRLARRFLRPEYGYVDVVQRFRTLRPDEVDLSLRRRFRQLHETPAGTARHGRLREDLIRDNADLARKLARRAARRLARPGDAGDAWTIALVKAVDGHDPRYGDFVPYLRKRIHGEVRTQARQEWQSGTARVLQGRTAKVSRARDDLRQHLRREPTDAEVATYLGVTVQVVAETLAALGARHARPLHADVVGPTGQAEAAGMSAAMRRRLARLDDRLRMVVELHFFAGLDIAEIADRIGVEPHTAERTLTAAIAELRRQCDEQSSG